MCDRLKDETQYYILKNLGVVTRAYNPSIGEGRVRWLLGAPWKVSLDESMSFWLLRAPVSKIKSGQHPWSKSEDRSQVCTQHLPRVCTYAHRHFLSPSPLLTHTPR